MAFAPLILRGNLTAGGDSVGVQVTSFTLRATRDDVEIPATFGARKSHAAGDDDYEIEIAYLQDIDDDALSEIFWAAVADDAGTIEFGGTFKPGAVSATNPLFTCTAVVTGVGRGGQVRTVGQDTQTFPLVGRPVKTTTPPT